MKKTAFIILPLLIILGCRDENDEEPCPVCHNSDSIAGDIIAHYMLDGDARDTSINRINGSLYGNPGLTSDRYDIPNSAFYFDGMDDFISAEIGNHDPLAVSLWFAHRNNEIGKAYVIFDYGENAFRSEVDMTSGATRTFCYINDTAVIEMFSPKMEYSSDMVWHHLYVDTGSDTTNPRMYIDGRLEGILEEKQVLDIVTSMIYFGRAFTGTFTQATSFEGKIDDIVIYKRVLSEEEIISIFDNYSFY